MNGEGNLPDFDITLRCTVCGKTLKVLESVAVSDPDSRIQAAMMDHIDNERSPGHRGG
jgi:hypothetical protein